MSLSDWDTYSGGSGAVSFNVDVLDPLVETSSLQIVNTNSAYGNMVVKDSSGRTKGVNAGRLRTILRLDGPYSALGTTNMFGLAAMQSEEDLTSGTADAYLWGLRYTGNGATNQWLSLRKVTSGISGLGTLLDEVSITPFALDSVITLEFEWVEADATLGGTILRGRQGTMTDYSDLTEIVAYFDNSSPLVTTVAEGIFTKLSTISSANAVYTLDTTELDVLV